MIIPNKLNDQGINLTKHFNLKHPYCTLVASPLTCLDLDEDPPIISSSVPTFLSPQGVCVCVCVHVRCSHPSSSSSSHLSALSLPPPKFLLLCQTQTSACTQINTLTAITPHASSSTHSPNPRPRLASLIDNRPYPTCIRVITLIQPQLQACSGFTRFLLRDNSFLLSTTTLVLILTPPPPPPPSQLPPLLPRITQTSLPTCLSHGRDDLRSRPSVLSRHLAASVTSLGMRTGQTLHSRQ